jgi:hypothetical protein
MSDTELYSDDNLYVACEECNIGRFERSLTARMLLRLIRLRLNREAAKESP